MKTIAITAVLVLSMALSGCGVFFKPEPGESLHDTGGPSKSDAAAMFFFLADPPLWEEISQ